MELETLRTYRGLYPPSPRPPPGWTAASVSAGALTGGVLGQGRLPNGGAQPLLSLSTPHCGGGRRGQDYVTGGGASAHGGKGTNGGAPRNKPGDSEQPPPRPPSEPRARGGGGPLGGRRRGGAAGRGVRRAWAGRSEGRGVRRAWAGRSEGRGAPNLGICALSGPAPRQGRHTSGLWPRWEQLSLLPASRPGAPASSPKVTGDPTERP